MGGNGGGLFGMGGKAGGTDAAGAGAGAVCARPEPNASAKSSSNRENLAVCCCCIGGNGGALLGSKLLAVDAKGSVAPVTLTLLLNTELKSSSKA